MAVKRENPQTQAGSAQASATAGEAPPQAPKRRGRAKGQPVGPRLVWSLERDQALARVLQAGWTKQADGTWTKNPDHNGSVKTAASVAAALVEDPAFASPEAPVTPARVKSHLDSEISSREKATPPKPVHGWMRLSINRSKLNSEVFD